MFIPFTYTLDVLPKLAIISFDTIPKAHLIAVNEPDTLKFAAFTDPSGGNILFTAATLPALDTNHVKVIAQGSRVLVIINSIQKGLYKVTCYAQSGTVYDTANVELTAYDKPVLSEKSKITNLSPGAIDTLLFTAKYDPTDSVNLKLMDSSSFKSGVVSVSHATTPESLKIIFKPDEVKTYIFSIIISGKYSIDTVTIQKVVKYDMTMQDNVPPVTASAPANNATGISLLPTFSWTGGGDADNDSVFYKVLYGNDAATLNLQSSIVSQKSVILTSKLAANTKYWWKVIAYSRKYTDTTKSDVLSFTTINDDNAGPVITLQSPATNNSKVSSSSVSVEVKCTDANWIASVTGSLGAAPISVTKGIESIYSAAVVNLVLGANKIIFTAADSSTIANKTIDTFTIIYDPTMTDNVAPSINMKNPKTNEERVETDTITVQVVCKDDNGIATVTAVRSINAVTLTSSNDSIYAVKLTALTAGKSDTVTFTATDKSANANVKTFSVVVKYDRKLSEITQSVPANNVAGVAVKPTFTWSGGDDPDGNAVTYVIKYGTSATNLTKTVTAISTTTTTLLNSLTANTTYYWQVVAKSSVNNDTSASDVWAFTTVEAAPVITKDPADTSVLVGNKASFFVTASGISTKYQWQKGTTDIFGATSSNYTTAVTASNDDGTIYRCLVSNGGGADTSTGAKLTIQYSVIYEGNGNTGGSVPVDANAYSKDETVAVKGSTGGLALVRTGFAFAGWNTNIGGTGIDYTAGTGTFKMASASVTLYAKWIAVYTVTFDGQGATTEANPATKSVSSATTINALPTEPTKTGCFFSGWWTAPNGGGTQFTASTIVFANITVYADWDAVDNDGNVYNTISIGNQVWMVENLRTTKYIDNNTIPNVTDIAVWTALSTPGYCYYNNTLNTDSIKKFGALYNWYAVDTKKLAPKGWHVSNISEWDTMRDYLIANGYNWDGSMTDDKTAKSLAAKTDWKTSTSAGAPGDDLTKNNKSGFSAFPGGYRIDGSFGGIGYYGCWWSATEHNATNADQSDLNFGNNFLITYNYSLKNYGYSVRLVRD